MYIVDGIMFENKCYIETVNYRPGNMNDTNILLKAYFEALYDLLESKRQLLVKTVEDLLAEEIVSAGYEDFDEDKFAAYLEASLAFVDERIELYNPVGIQYLYDRSRAKEAFELELQLNWYDSSDEFEDLVDAVREIEQELVAEQGAKPLAERIIREVGAFPDKSIISAYQIKPALNKLPDYVVARAIEQIL